MGELSRTTYGSWRRSNCSFSARTGSAKTATRQLSTGAWKRIFLRAPFNFFPLKPRACRLGVCRGLVRYNLLYRTRLNKFRKGHWFVLLLKSTRRELLNRACPPHPLARSETARSVVPRSARDLGVPLTVPCRPIDTPVAFQTLCARSRPCLCPGATEGSLLLRLSYLSVEGAARVGAGSARIVRAADDIAARVPERSRPVGNGSGKAKPKGRTRTRVGTVCAALSPCASWVCASLRSGFLVVRDMPLAAGPPNSCLPLWPLRVPAQTKITTQAGQRQRSMARGRRSVG